MNAEKQSQKYTENSYLDTLIDCERIDVFLVNGIKLGGRLSAHDERCIFLNTFDKRTMLIFKKAIASMIPA